MWSSAHLRRMSVISSSRDTSAAIRCSTWKKRLMSSCFLHRHHTIGVNWASASPLRVISWVGGSRRILRLAWITAMEVGLTCIPWLILHSHLSSLTSYGCPYHRLTVLLDWVLSVLSLILLLSSLVLSMRLILLLSVLLMITTISLSELCCHLCWSVLILSCSELITCMLILPPFYLR